jgi:hypothetical protein
MDEKWEAQRKEDEKLNKVFDKAFDKAFDKVVKRNSVMLHQEVFAILGPVFDALLDRAIDKHYDMLRDEAMDAATEATGLYPCGDSEGRFMVKMADPAGEQ